MSSLCFVCSGFLVLWHFAADTYRSGFLRKRAGQAGQLFFANIVRECERLGVWGEVLPNRLVFPASVGVQGGRGECFTG